MRPVRRGRSSPANPQVRMRGITTLHLSRNSSSFCAPFQLRRSGAVRFGPRFESLRETVTEHDRCITLLTICRAGSAPTVWSHEESVWEPVGQPVHLSSSSHFLLFLSLDVSLVSE